MTAAQRAPLLLCSALAFLFSGIFGVLYVRSGADSPLLAVVTLSLASYGPTVGALVVLALRHDARETRAWRRCANRHASKRAFAELHGLHAYKAVPAGSLGIKVDADQRHQTCPRCGYTSRENRPKQGLLFVCGQRQYTLHDDLVGARSVALRTLLIRQDWMRRVKPVRCPSRDQAMKPKPRAGAWVCSRVAVESGHKPPALALRVT